MKSTIVVGMSARYIPGIVGLAAELSKWCHDDTPLISMRSDAVIRLHSAVDQGVFADAQIVPMTHDITFIRVVLSKDIKPNIWPTWQLLRYELLLYKRKPVSTKHGIATYSSNPPARQRVTNLRRAAYYGEA